MLVQRPVAGRRRAAEQALKPAPGQQTARFGTVDRWIVPSARSKRVLDPCMLDPKLSMKAADAQLRSAQPRSDIAHCMRVCVRFSRDGGLATNAPCACACIGRQHFAGICRKDREKTRQPTVSVPLCVKAACYALLRQHSTCCAIVAGLSCEDFAIGEPARGSAVSNRNLRGRIMKLTGGQIVAR